MSAALYLPTFDEWLLNNGVGDARFNYGVAKGLNPLEPGEEPGRRTPYDRLVSERHGANGEHGVCQWLGCPWPAYVGTFDEPDVVHNGIRYEIRTTSYRTGHLTIKAKDDVDVWVLVIAELGLIGDPVPYRYRIAGCVTALQGKRDEYRRGYGWWLPRSALIELPEGGPTHGLRELNGAKVS